MSEWSGRSSEERRKAHKRRKINAESVTEHNTTVRKFVKCTEKSEENEEKEEGTGAKEREKERSLMARSQLHGDAEQ